MSKQKKIIFVDLDETLWHSTTPMYLNKDFLLPENLFDKTEARKIFFDEIEKNAAQLLNDEGLVEGTFEFERKIHDAKNEIIFALAVKAGWKEFWFSGDEHYMTKLRSNAVEFLTAISEFGELHVCTSSTTEYANMLTEAFDIKKFFKSISAREQLKSEDVFPLKKNTKWILVDDLPPFSESIMRKMRFLTGSSGTAWDEGKRRVFQVEEFTGDPLDTFLMPYVEGIKERLEKS